MTHRLHKIIFVLFFLSGFCSLLYQIIWMRMAFASFGVITPVLSVIISIFMLGLAMGSLGGGKLIVSLTNRSGKSPMIFYALTELLIGCGALSVGKLFSWGQSLLLAVGEMDSLSYLLLSDIIIGLSILPWCVLMGFTFPFMMHFIKGLKPDEVSGFSYLYLANVLGAMCGTSLTAWILIEVLGFYHTLMIGALINLFIFMAALTIGIRYPVAIPAIREETLEQHFPERNVSVLSRPFLHIILFFTGFISMAMEVIWVRNFTPVLLTTIYAFASVLSVYLLATWIGSLLYRRHLRTNKVASPGYLLGLLGIFALLPLVMNDPRFIISEHVVLISIFPFCTALGYLTPQLIDDDSSGIPHKAGQAYAVNILGCVIGPLFTSYVLLPKAGEKFSTIALGIIFLFLYVAYYKKNILGKTRLMILSFLAGVMLLFSAGVTLSYEDIHLLHAGNVRDFYILGKDRIVHRDHTATVISAGEGLNKILLVNGIAITSLSPITKIMAHLPLMLLDHQPASALVICLGMGTTYRSALSWNIRTTAVELVPGVKDAFGYYFNDADRIMKNPKGKMIVDDGRRFLNRTAETFDVITIDPPPPLEAAQSGLLYSEEFYAAAKKKLRPGGILQQWFPCGEFKIFQAVARSLTNAFPYVRVYRSVEGWGFHFLASVNPIVVPDMETLIGRIPPSARRDLFEWYAENKRDDLQGFLQLILKNEIPLSWILSSDKRITITDDRPLNEYFFLRRKKDMLRGTYQEISCEPGAVQ